MKGGGEGRSGELLRVRRSKRSSDPRASGLRVYEGAATEPALGYRGGTADKDQDKVSADVQDTRSLLKVSWSRLSVMNHLGLASISPVITRHSPLWMLLFDMMGKE